MQKNAIKNLFFFGFFAKINMYLFTVDTVNFKRGADRTPRGGRNEKSNCIIH